MYYYIKGTVVHKTDEYVVIDANGVGYKIITSRQNISKIEKIGCVALFYTYLNVREDVLELYGFLSCDELSFFELLISVSGIGPKAAVNILSDIPVPKLALAIVSSDIKTITKAQGIGPKLAQRLVLELKDKIKNQQFAPEAIFEEPCEDNYQNEAVSALIALGYSMKEAQTALSEADALKLPTEEAIKKALMYLI